MFEGALNQQYTPLLETSQGKFLIGFVANNNQVYLILLNSDMTVERGSAWDIGLVDEVVGVAKKSNGDVIVLCTANGPNGPGG